MQIYRLFRYIILQYIFVLLISQVASVFLPPILEQTYLYNKAQNLKKQGGVQILNANDVKHIIEFSKKTPEATLIINFFNPSCPHCINFEPIYERTALDFEKWGKPVLFFKADVTQDIKNDNILNKHQVDLVEEFKIEFIPDVRVRKRI